MLAIAVVSPADDRDAFGIESYEGRNPELPAMGHEVSGRGSHGQVSRLDVAAVAEAHASQTIHGTRDARRERNQTHARACTPWTTDRPSRVASAD